MRSFFRGLFSSLLILFILSVIISVIANWRDGEEAHELNLPVGARPGKKLAQTRFSIPMSYVAGNNFLWWRSVNMTREMAADAKGKTEDHSQCLSSSYTNIDSTFYDDNEITHGSFEIAFAALITAKVPAPPAGKAVDPKAPALPAVPTLDEQKLSAIASYMNQSRLAEAGFGISDVQLISPYAPPAVNPFALNYGERSENTQKAVELQLKICSSLTPTRKIAADEKPDASKLYHKNCVLEIGYAGANTIRFSGVTFARSQAIRNAAAQVYNAWVALERADANNGIRILVRNSFASEHRALKGQIAKGEVVIAGEDPADLIRFRNELINYNFAYGRPIRDIAQRVGYALDAGKLSALWLSSNSTLFKDAEGRPMNQPALMQELSTGYSALVRRDYRGVVVENPIMMLYASYTALNETSEDRNTLNLPYSRGSADRVTRQLKLLKGLFELSDIGNGVNPGFIVLDVPRKKLFPLIHYTLKPVTKLMALTGMWKADDQNAKLYYPPQQAGAWTPEFRSNYADRSEQAYSLQLVRDYLTLKGI